jgi:hypothetical protein
MAYESKIITCKMDDCTEQTVEWSDSLPRASLDNLTRGASDSLPRASLDNLTRGASDSLPRGYGLLTPETVL